MLDIPVILREDWLPQVLGKVVEICTTAAELRITQNHVMGFN